MERTRILLVGLTSMLADLVRGIVESNPDLEVVGEIGGLSELAAAGERMRPDVVLVPLEHGHLPSPCRQLMERRAHTRVVGLVQHGRTGVLWEMRPRLEPLGALSPPILVAAIRGEGSRETPAAR